MVRQEITKLKKEDKPNQSFQDNSVITQHSKSPDRYNGQIQNVHQTQLATKSPYMSS